jgi:uncharacterized protein Yka (UPF0111/DUF47 family)
VRLIPRDEHFFELFSQLAQRITTSAKLLHELFSDPARIAHFETAIKNVEHEADDLAYQVNARIDTSFITPIDREDIHRLASRLDNVVDLIDGTARRAAMFRISESRPQALRLTAVLVEAAALIEKSVNEVKKPKNVAENGREMKRLEEAGDAVYQEAVGALFSGAPDPLDVIKWKELFDKIEEAIDECDDVSNVLESIALKNS